MSVNAVVGNKGSGKSYFLTSELYAAHNAGKKIYCNYALSFPFKKITMASFLGRHEELNNCVIGIDEAVAYLDCRRSMTETNRVLNFFIQQSRKLDVDIYLVTLDFDSFDLRLRNSCEQVFVFKKPLKFYPELNGFSRVNGCEITPDYFDCVRLDYTQNPPAREEFVVRATQEIFDLYDTHQFFSLDDAEKSKWVNANQSAEDRRLKYKKLRKLGFSAATAGRAKNWGDAHLKTLQESGYNTTK